MIRVSKTYGAVTLSGEFGSARDGIEVLDGEAESIGLTGEATAETSDAADKPKRTRRTKAQIEADNAAAKVAPASTAAPGPSAGPITLAPPPAADPNPGNVVDPAWINSGAVPPPPPPAMPQMAAPPVAPPPGMFASPPPPAFEPEDRADANTPGWKNYVESQVEQFRLAYPDRAESSLVEVVSFAVGAVPADFGKAREWLGKLSSPDLQGVSQSLNAAMAKAVAGVTA